MRRRVLCGTALGFMSLCLLLAAAAAGSTSRQLDPPSWVRHDRSPAVKFDVSPPLVNIPPAPAPDRNKK